MLSEGSTDGINDSTNAAKKTSINFSKAKTNFSWVHITIVMRITCLQNKTEIFRFKANNNISL